MRRLLSGLVLIMVALASVSFSVPLASGGEGYELVRNLSSEKKKVRRSASRKLLEKKDLSVMPAMVDALFFTPRHLRTEIVATLEGLSGEKIGSSYHGWVEYVGSRTDIQPRAGYLEWKGEIFSRLDPQFRKIFYSGAPYRIRLEEILSGGVRLDGIPSLDNPRHVPASEAKFMRAKERVFGVTVGGQHRAYPVRVLSWHEMLNDVIGGEPVTLSFCTLCGSGIAYATKTPNGKAYTFGTSGLLYRSNKLMYDRQSYTLWSNLTGEPVVGRLALTSLKLPVLPNTVTTWSGWVERHPDTTVMVPDNRLAARWRFDYTSGAADRMRRGVAFPVWRKSDRLDRDTEIYALRIEGEAKAYPIEILLEQGVVNDQLGGSRLVLLADRTTGAVRAYASGGLTFRRGESDTELVDDSDRRWRVTEEALVSAGIEPLERLPGHTAFWFGWYGFYPRTEVYEAP